jgi:hypothetical protein
MLRYPTGLAVSGILFLTGNAGFGLLNDSACAKINFKQATRQELEKLIFF